MRRALIGIDGNCGFAGIGLLPEAPANEWVFVEIRGDVQDRGNRLRAVGEALQKLKDQVAPEAITYALDSSHPNAC